VYAELGGTWWSVMSNPTQAAHVLGKLLKHVEAHSALRRNVTIEEVGNVAAFLLSGLSSAITGEITYVDCGFSIGAVRVPED
jgi:enoyl-[acyl-carrier protein] reductase I